MPGKDRIIRGIDIPLSGAFSAGPDPAGTAANAPPVVASFGPPTNLALTKALERSAGTPTAQIGATWYPPAGVAPASYVVQWSTSNTFPDPGTNGQEAQSESSNIGGLAVLTTYYVRVAAIVANLVSAWSTTVSITTDADTTPPNPVTSVAWTWGASGDLDITWTDPTSANLKTVEVEVWSDSGKTTFYRALYAAPGALRTVYTAAMNAQDTSNVYDAAVYIEVKALSWGGIYSTVATPASQPSKAVPGTPSGLTTSWAGDTGATGADCVISWTAQADAIAYRLTIDGVARELAGSNRYTYTLDTNRTEHSGTPDPVLSLSLIALDGLKQASTATTGTATNAAPSAPTVTLIAGAMSLLVCQVTSAPAADFAAYEYKWTRDGSTVTRTLESASAEQQYEASGAGDQGAHSWTCTVRQKDLFGQYSTGTASSSVTLDNLTIDYLRSGAFYSDDAGGTFTSPASGTLAALKDGTTTSGGVSYAA